MDLDTNGLSEQAQNMKVYLDKPEKDRVWNELSESNQNVILSEDSEASVYGELNSSSNAPIETKEPVKPEVIPEQPATPNVIDEIPQDRARIFKEAAQSRADELNTLKMQKSAHDHKLKTDSEYRNQFFRDLGIEVPKKQAIALKTDDDSLFDEDNQRAHIDETTELRRELNSLKSSIKVTDKNRLDEAQRLTALRNITAFASENPQLATSASVESIDSVYSSVYSADKTQEQVNQDVLTRGVSQKDLENYSKLMSVHQKVSTGLYPSYRSAYFDSEHYEAPGQLPTPQANIDQVRQREQQTKLEQIQGQPNVDMSTSGENEMGIGSLERAEKEFKSINDRYNGQTAGMPADVFRAYQSAREIVLQSSL